MTSLLFIARDEDKGISDVWEQELTQKGNISSISIAYLKRYVLEGKTVHVSLSPERKKPKSRRSR